MKFDGREFASEILDSLKPRVDLLKEKGIVPTLAVILVGDNPSSLSYIRQKRKAAEYIGAVLALHKIDLSELEKTIADLNSDASVSGIIIQRPVPGTDEKTQKILENVLRAKDVDGLVPGSPFDVPVAAAVFKILEKIFSEKHIPGNFIDWLRSQKIAVIGRGETAGKPIADMFAKQHCATSIIHSQTENADTILKQSDIIISCVGKPNIVSPAAISKGVILIGVGLGRGEEDKLHGDFDEAAVSDIASWYTPTPGGVGPVNVACLMQNLVKACTIV